MRTEREFLLERLDRLAIVLDELMPRCAELVRDAIDLLKEQKAVEPIESSIPGVLLCGACKCSVMREEGYRFRHCPWCGRKVKWE